MAPLLAPLANFPSETVGIIVSITVPLVILVELRVLLRLSRQTQDNGTLLPILAALFIPLGVIIALANAGIGRINTVVAYFGIALLLLGFGLRQWSIHLLGKAFTPQVRVHKDQQLVQRGPYRILRHPSYTGILLEIIGCALAFSNSIGAILAGVVLWLALRQRIAVEEAVLVNAFGARYREYQRKTKRLIPFLY